MPRTVWASVSCSEPENVYVNEPAYANERGDLIFDDKTRLYVKYTCFPQTNMSCNACKDALAYKSAHRLSNCRPGVRRAAADRFEGFQT
jgi:hypothetical protein